MKKIVFIALCVVSLVLLVSCGSTAPCGLSSKNSKQPVLNDFYGVQQEVAVVCSSK